MQLFSFIRIILRFRPTLVPVHQIGARRIKKFECGKLTASGERDALDKERRVCARVQTQLIHQVRAAAKRIVERKISARLS